MRLLAALAALAVAPSTAAAAGFPITGMDTTHTGATAPGDPYRYVAFPGDSTLLVKILRADGVPERHRVLRGTDVVTAVAQDASTTGLSADGSTLVLSTPRRTFPQRVSKLVIVDTATLLPQRRLALRGDLHALTFEDVSTMNLRARTGRIDLLSQTGEPVRQIDASTFAVTTPRPR